MELYINSTWTQRQGNAYVAEAFAWSQSGNHATINATGHTSEEAYETLTGVLHELNLVPTTFIATDWVDDDSSRQSEQGTQ